MSTEMPAPLHRTAASWTHPSRECSLHLASLLFGEGNGNPLQYSCLENSMDGGGWWAIVHGVAESETPERLHFLSLLLLLDWGRGKRLQPGLLQPPAWWVGAGSGGSFWAHTA